MELYSGTKTIKARPMNLGDYNEYRGWTIPANENPSDEGYLVGYTNSDGKFDGTWGGGCHYVSWSPKRVFEAAYHKGDISNASDGYHTFKELYDFRKVYNALLFNEWAKQDKFSIHKATRHSDGEMCFGGGWFVVMATLPTGQISNHYEMKDWDMFDVPVRCKADEYDGHVTKDVFERMSSFLGSSPNSISGPAPDPVFSGYTCKRCGKAITDEDTEVVVQAKTADVFCSPQCEAATV